MKRFMNEKISLIYTLNDIKLYIKVLNNILYEMSVVNDCQ